MTECNETYPRKKNIIGIREEEMVEKICPTCRQLTNSSHARLIRDSCGHIKCRMCLFNEEQGCKTCNLQETKGSSVESTNDDKTNTESSVTGEEVKLVVDKTYTCKNTVGNEQDLQKLTTIDMDCMRNLVDSYFPAREVRYLNSNVNFVALPGATYDDAPIFVTTERNVNNTEPELIDNEALTNKNLKSLDRSHILVIPGSPQKYKCTACNKIFKNKKMKYYHNSCITGVKPYKCNHCDRSFVQRTHFLYHESTHSGHKPYSCNLCDKAFPQKSKLNRHMQSHTIIKKKYLCDICNKSYSNKYDYDIHLNTHDDTIVPKNTCEVCKKSFYSLAHVKRHMRTHADERPYKCDQCSKSFKDNSLLKRHKKIHQRNKPFQCADCNKVFITKSELTRHIITHSEDKPFSCEHCQTVFRRKDNLNRHISHHHSKISISKKNQLPNVIEDTNDKRILKTTNVNKKDKHKEKKEQKFKTKVILKSHNKVSIADSNSKEQINSRLDPMGNITPVIRTTTELSNAVPVINGPIRIRKPEDKTENNKKTSYIEPIPHADVININKRIEEKLYPQNISSKYIP